MIDPRIQLGDRVTLHYRIACLGEEVVDTFKSGPETFPLGGGEMEPRLEHLLVGLAAGERQTWQLAPWQAFGDRDESLVQHLPQSEFRQRMETLQPGLRIDFELPSGETLSGSILSIDQDSVVIDFNHPLADLPIEFEVQILAIERGTSDAQ